MANALEGKRVLITGAASGLGRAMALGLLDAGATVLVTDIAGVALEQMITDVASYGDHAIVIAADLNSIADIESLMDEAQRRLSGVDVLVNNAGIGSSFIRPDFVLNPVRFWEHSTELTLRFFQVNAVAPYMLAVRFVEGMRERKWGRIISVTTSLDTMLMPGMAGYGGSKAALEAHTAIMAADLAGSGVTANVLIPGGPANTPILPDVNGFERGSLIQPEAMVPPILWLASDRADGVTGRRFAAVDWDKDLAPEIAAEKAGADIAWRGHGRQGVYPGWKPATLEA